MSAEPRKKRFVFFDFITHFGGAQRSTVLLCRRLAETDDVAVLDAYGCCRDYVRAIAAAAIPIRVLMPDAKEVYIGRQGRRLHRIFRAVCQAPALHRLRRKLAEAIEEFSPDVIWTNGQKALFLLQTSRRIRRFPIAMYVRGWHRKHQVSPLSRWAIKRADVVLALSNATAEALASWGVPRAGIRVVFPGMDAAEVVRDGAAEPHAAMPGRRRACKILLPAQLVRTKGHHAAIEAARLLKAGGRDLVLWIAGDVKAGDRTGYAQYLRGLISKHDLGQTVFLLGLRDDVRSLMRVADVVILPTHTEGFGRVILEAMILRRPVVSTPVGGVTDLIQDGKTGLLFPVDDGAALADRIERLLSDADLVRRITQTAHRRALDKFSCDRQITLARQAFLQAAANKAGNSHEHGIPT